MLLSFVFKDSQQEHCLLRNMIIECHLRSDLSLQEPIKLLFEVFARYFTFLLAISLFAPYFNKNSKTINQSDFRKNAQYVTMPEKRYLCGIK